MSCPHGALYFEGVFCYIIYVERKPYILTEVCSMYGNGYGFGNYGMPGGYGGYGGYRPYAQTPPIDQSSQGFNQFQNGQQANGAAFQKPALQVPWVNGEVGAQAYLIAPNSAVLLMDSDNPIFYIKSSDMSGKASIQAYRYEELKHDESVAPADKTYVTKEEFEAFKASVLGRNAEEEKI